MKKFLLTALLIAAVVTSLTAGSLAAYNRTIETTSEAIHSKKFYFNTTASNSFTTPLNIVPGDEIQYIITVNQNTEVPMFYTGNVKLTGERDLLNRLRAKIEMPKMSKDGLNDGVEVIEVDGATLLDSLSGSSGGSSDQFTYFKKAGEESFDIKVTVKWKDGKERDDDADWKASDKTARVKFTITGKGYEKDQKFDADNPDDEILPIYTR